MTVIVLVMTGGGCGSSGPDNGMSLQSAPTVSRSHAEIAGVPPSLSAGDATMVDKTIEGNMNGTASMNQSRDYTSAAIPTIPFSVAKDLQSPEARDRYRALEYWEAKDSKAPLDPVFEAIEDDDPAVRAKATAIVERYWEAEQTREKE